ncbi:MAG: putative baseplate assembly protein [Blastocatellia bacterium]
MNKDCGCCKGTEKLTPAPIVNRPGLNALAYRIGTHATFLETMKARLSSDALSALHGLTTRAADDPAIALLDGWATVADVLTFYQERIANEGYLSTATERRSVLELARLVGYALRPGVASTVYLAYTLEKDAEVNIPTGARAQSVPAPGELQQSFETAEKLEARARWNNLKPRLTRPKYITLQQVAGETRPFDLYFKGVTTLLKPGDPLLFIFSGARNQQVFRRIATVEIQAADDRTRVTLQTLSLTAPPVNRLATFNEAANEIKQIIDRHLRLDQFEVSANTAMARRATSALNRWSENLASFQSRIAGLEDQRERTEPLSLELGTWLQEEVLPAVREEHELARQGRFVHLEPWLGGLEGELVEAAERLTNIARRDVAGINNQPSQNRRPAAEAATFGSLLGALKTPPSIPPPNAQRFDRQASQVFGVERLSPDADKRPTPNLPDIGLQLAVSMNSLLRDSLYAALGNAEVTTATALESADALEVKAAPFGYNAPLKPITDDRGVPVGQQEWPLAGTIAIEMVVSSALTPRSATITLTRDGESASETAAVFDTNGEATIQIQDGDQTRTFKLNFDTAPEATVFKVSEAEAVIETITVRPIVVGPLLTIAGAGSAKFRVKVGADAEKSIPPGHELHYTSGGRAIKIATTGELLSVKDESPGAIAQTVRSRIALNAQYDQITPGSWIVIEYFDHTTPQTLRRVFRVVSARTVSRAGYNLTGQVTELTLSEPWLDDAWLAAHNNSLSAFRGVTVYAQNQPRELAEEPIDADVEGSEIELDGVYPALKSGRWLIVAGERTDIQGSSGVKASELVMLASVTQGVQQIEPADEPNSAGVATKTLINLPGDKTHTFITLAEPLAYSYKLDTVVIYGNVVRGTHGETHSEVLGSGDGSRALQAFALRQSPLTFVAASTPAGAESTLEVRVNEVLWHESDSLSGLKPTERRYITRTDDENKTTLIFGDGEQGARLPTGVENIKSVYRTGIGQPGNVQAQQISLLATRPLGVKEVINPIRASGGADRESRDQARGNAPLAVTSLDRLVSVQDYEDFARTFAGIGKASATRLSDGRQQLVHLTIAGADDIPIDYTSDLYRNLRLALQRSGDPFQPFKVETRELVLLIIIAKARVHPDYLWETVEPKIRASLLDAFSFQRRELGQDVLLSEVISVAQQVPGVIYVDVDVLDSVSEDIITVPQALEDKLEQLASAPVLSQRINVEMPGIGRVRAAQLAMLNAAIPDTLILKELTL